jgi:hypothetical protein
MKFLNAIAAAAVIGASVIATSAPVDANQVCRRATDLMIPMTVVAALHLRKISLEMYIETM